MRLNELRIQEISYRLRDGNVCDEDILDLLQSHESLREDLSKVEGGNLRTWKENELIKAENEIMRKSIVTMMVLHQDESINDKQFRESAQVLLAESLHLCWNCFGEKTLKHPITGEQNECPICFGRGEAP